jgi:hypothetical protein
MIRMALVIGLLNVGMAIGQAPAVPAAAPAAVAAKPLAFDVVSIRQNMSAQSRQMGMPVFGPTADGYRMASAPCF